MRRDKGKASNVTRALPAATSNIILQEKRFRNKNEHEDDNRERKRIELKTSEDMIWNYEMCYD